MFKCPNTFWGHYCTDCIYAQVYECYLKKWLSECKIKCVLDSCDMLSSSMLAIIALVGGESSIISTYQPDTVTPIERTEE